jgi:hypothetical protein
LAGSDGVVVGAAADRRQVLQSRGREARLRCVGDAAEGVGEPGRRRCR